MIPATISAVIPCYRQAHFLGEAIESVLAQSHPASRIVVVDDGSPDDVAGVVARYPTVQLLRQENRGVSMARNAGLALCDSDLIWFLDADDRLLPHAFETSARALLDRPDAAFAWGFNRLIDPHGVIIPCTPRSPIEATYEELIKWNAVGPPVDVAFRRSMVVEVGGFDPSVYPCEDYDLYLRLAHRHPTVCHGQVVGEYRRHGANLSADAGFMLEGALKSLRNQEPVVAGNPRLVRLLRNRVRYEHAYYDGVKRVDALREAVNNGHMVGAVLGIGGLAIRHPGVFWRIVRARTGRLWTRIRG